MIRYKMQIHDSPRTIEQQLLLLAQDAQRLLDIEHAISYPGSGIAEDVKPTPEKRHHRKRNLQRRVVETDIFMSGYLAGQQKKEEPPR